MDEAFRFSPLWGPAESFQHRRGLVGLALLKEEDNDRVEKDGREARGEGWRALPCSRGVVTVAQTQEGLSGEDFGAGRGPLGTQGSEW